MVCTAQVSHQIFSKTDLMATDSLVPVVTVRPPAEFLSSLTQTVFLPTPLPSRPRPGTTRRGEAGDDCNDDQTLPTRFSGGEAD